MFNYLSVIFIGILNRYIYRYINLPIYIYVYYLFIGILMGISIRYIYSVKYLSGLGFRSVPTLLEYFAYVFQFQVLMAGPVIFYRDYVEFVNGQNFIKYTTSTDVSLKIIVN